MARQLNPDAGRFDMRAAPAEIRAWARAATADDRSLASWLRQIANAAAGAPSHGKKRQVASKK